MKKKINPTNGKEEYRCNYSEAAEHIYMTVGSLKYRYTKACSLHESMKPKLTYLHGIAGFWLTDLEHYKKKYIGQTRRNKEKVAEEKETADVLEFSEKSKA
tara:strand:+ start:1570 stop:1872 length:303 start_codon:yes stop_codon:yes gene_type:complete